MRVDWYKKISDRGRFAIEQGKVREGEIDIDGGTIRAGGYTVFGALDRMRLATLQSDRQHKKLQRGIRRMNFYISTRDGGIGLLADPSNDRNTNGPRK